MRDYEKYMYKLVYSDILCSGAPRCCDAPDLT